MAFLVLNLKMNSEWLKLFNALQLPKFMVQRFYLPNNISLTNKKFDIPGFSDANKDPTLHTLRI